VDLVLYELQDGVARITLNRSEKRNALNREMITAMDAALARASSDADARVILITGAGKDFCAGLDLLALDRGNDATITDHLATARHLANLMLAIRRHKLPIIAAVQGRALGGGAGIATASDLIVASENGAIGYPEINIGFVPAMVAAFLRRSVPEKRVFEILALGQTLSANDAHAIGLVNQVFAETAFAESALSYARDLASKSTSALSLLKNLLYQTDMMTLEKALETGVHVNALARVSDDAKRGFAAFLGKKS
jgi:methylglutaconyl-CoA hydratase